MWLQNQGSEPPFPDISSTLAPDSQPDKRHYLALCIPQTWCLRDNAFINHYSTSSKRFSQVSISFLANWPFSWLCGELLTFFNFAHCRFDSIVAIIICPTTTDICLPICCIVRYDVFNNKGSFIPALFTAQEIAQLVIPG